MSACAVKNCLLGECKPGCQFFHREPGISPERQRELSAACDKGDVRPFYCGTQGMDWRASNCDRCSKMPAEIKPGVFTCEIDYCISYAAIAGGAIPEEIAKRIGYYGEKISWKCGEFKEGK